MLDLDKIYNMDCIEGMKLIDDDSIDLIVFSPPYWNAKNYDSSKSYRSKMPLEFTLNEYLKIMKNSFMEMFDILKEGRYCCIIIDGVTVDKKYYNIPMMFEEIMGDIGFVYHIPLYWLKPLGSQGMWKPGASWSIKNIKPLCYYPNQRLEHILLFRKGEPINKNGKTDLSYNELKKWLYNVWEIKTVSTKEHKCPFPMEIPYRLIKLLSFVGDIVLDPFIGIGTTAVACKRLNRKFIGFETNNEYCDIANQKLKNMPERLEKWI